MLCIKGLTKHLACFAFATYAPIAHADDAVTIDAIYTADVSSTIIGGQDDKLRYLDNFDVIAEADLAALIGWQGARAHVYVLNNMGAVANDGPATLQGVDNIEVGSHRLRLYEAWIEQSLGSGDSGSSIRAGLYDVNSEFYATDASGLLIAPAFGIGSEMAATGPRGPSIFPSTALAARLRIAFGEAAYAQAAIVNADARTLGDPGGINTSFDKGALLVSEAGWNGPLRLAIGAWQYTKRADDVFATDSAGNPLRHRSRGGYGLAEWRVAGSEGRTATLFARAGISDGKTSPFKGGLQTGVLFCQPIRSRTESALSLGVHRAWTSRGFRLSQMADGIVPARHESAVELTYSDRLAEHISVQPDVQYIIHPGGDANAKNAVVTTLRMTFDF